MAEGPGGRVHRSAIKFYQELRIALLDLARTKFRKTDEEIEQEGTVLPDPDQLYYLWDWFQDLTDWRSSGFSVGPLSHLEVECWARLMQMSPPPSPFEATVLRDLDREFRTFIAEKEEDSPAAEGGTPIADAARAIVEAREPKPKKRQKKRTDG